jgi:hypothetical protein
MPARKRKQAGVQPPARTVGGTGSVSGARPPGASFEYRGRRMVGIYAPPDDFEDERCLICETLGQWICPCGTVVFGRGVCPGCGAERINRAL